MLLKSISKSILWALRFPADNNAHSEYNSLCHPCICLKTSYTRRHQLSYQLVASVSSVRFIAARVIMESIKVRKHECQERAIIRVSVERKNSMQQRSKHCILNSPARVALSCTYIYLQLALALCIMFGTLIHELDNSIARVNLMKWESIPYWYVSLSLFLYF